MRINDETRKNARGERAGGGGGGGGGVTRYFAVARLRAPLECEIRRIGLGSLAAWTEHMLRAGSSASPLRTARPLRRRLGEEVRGRLRLRLRRPHRASRLA